MSGAKRRVHRGNDRAQRFLREQRDLVEADFRAIEARLRNEIAEQEKRDFREPPPPVFTPLPKAKRGDDDALLDLAIQHGARVAVSAREEAEARAEARQALKDRGVTFTREPRSIHVDPPRGRIGSVAKRTISKGKPELTSPYSYTRQGSGRWRERG